MTTSELYNSPRVRAHRGAAFLEQEANRREYHLAAKPLLQELGDIGLGVDVVGDLRYLDRTTYRRALPTLIDWLPKAPPRIQEDLVRTLSMPYARPEASLPMIEAFHRVPFDVDPNGTTLRWSCGNALEVLAHKSIEAEMIEIVRDHRYRFARQMVVLGLGKIKDPAIDAVLVELLDDPDVVGHAVIALRKRKATAARPRLEALRDYPEPWIRKEVVKALERIPDQ